MRTSVSYLGVLALMAVASVPVTAQDIPRQWPIRAAAVFRYNVPRPKLASGHTCEVRRSWWFRRALGSLNSTLPGTAA